jgi:hypothetical protein
MRRRKLYRRHSGSPPRRAEHVTLGIRVAGALFGQRVDDERWDADYSLAGLRRTDLHRAVYVDDRGADVPLASEEVHRLQLETSQPAPSQSQVASGQEHGAVAVGNSFVESVRQGAHLVTLHLGERDSDTGGLS